MLAATVEEAIEPALGAVLQAYLRRTVSDIENREVEWDLDEIDYLAGWKTWSTAQAIDQVSSHSTECRSSQERPSASLDSGAIPK